MTATMPSPNETACQTTIIHAARTLGYRVHHQRPSVSRAGRWASAIQGDPGWPDLVICGHDRLWVIELKRHGGKPTADQVSWLTALTRAGVDARLVIVPDHQQALIDELARHARSTTMKAQR